MWRANGIPRSNQCGTLSVTLQCKCSTCPVAVPYHYGTTVVPVCCQCCTSATSLHYHSSTVVVQSSSSLGGAHTGTRRVSVLDVAWILFSRTGLGVLVTRRPRTGDARRRREHVPDPPCPAVWGSSFRFIMGRGGRGMSLANGGVRKVLCATVSPMRYQYSTGVLQVQHQHAAAAVVG